MKEQTIRRAREGFGNQAGGMNAMIRPTEDGDSNDDCTEVQLNDEPAFGFDIDEEDDEVQKQGFNDDFQMFIEEDESNASQHSTSKPKPKKKKKSIVSRKDFLELKGKMDQILIAFSTSAG